MWESQDVYGDRQAEAAAKRAQRQLPEKPVKSKSSTGLGILRLSNKERTYLVSTTSI